MKIYSKSWCTSNIQADNIQDAHLFIYSIQKSQITIRFHFFELLTHVLANISQIVVINGYCLWCIYFIENICFKCQSRQMRKSSESSFILTKLKTSDCFENSVIGLKSRFLHNKIGISSLFVALPIHQQIWWCKTTK